MSHILRQKSSNQFCQHCDIETTQFFVGPSHLAPLKERGIGVKSKDTTIFCFRIIFQCSGDTIWFVVFFNTETP